MYGATRIEILGPLRETEYYKKQEELLKEGETVASHQDLNSIENSILQNGFVPEFDEVISKFHDCPIKRRGLVPVRAYYKALAERLLIFIKNQPVLELSDAIMKSSIICYLAGDMFNTRDESLYIIFVLPMIKSEKSPQTRAEFTKYMHENWNAVYQWFLSHNTESNQKYISLHTNDLCKCLEGRGILINNSK